MIICLRCAFPSLLYHSMEGKPAALSDNQPLFCLIQEAFCLTHHNACIRAGDLCSRSHRKVEAGNILVMASSQVSCFHVYHTGHNVPIFTLCTPKTL